MPRRFDFVSPGVQLNEIDRSQVIENPPADGILLIGRAQMGPAMEPIEIRSWEDWKSTFGNPMSGLRNNDSWRAGQQAAPNYAAYAAQAYLAAGVGPVKFIRLLGMESPNAGAGEYAGWTMGSNANSTISTNAGAYGLFLAPSASSGTQNATLAAIFYVSGAAVALSGTIVSSSSGYTDTAVSASTVINSAGSNCGFTIVISSSSGQTPKTFDFNNGGPAGNYIRSVFNTAPDIFKADENYNDASIKEPYFLGETFDVNVNRYITDQSAGKVYGFILALEGTAGINADDFQQEFTAAKTGWFIGQKPGQKKLFRLIALDGGEGFQNNYYCKISDIKTASGANSNGAFSLTIMQRGEIISQDTEIEKFSGLNLDASSDNYILKRIGDTSRTWNKSTGQFDVSGLYENISRYVRVEVASNIAGSDVPFGWAGQKKDASSSQPILSTDTATQGAWFDGKNSIALGNTEGLTLFGLHTNYTASLSWPTFGVTDASSSATTGASAAGYAASAVFGLRHCKRGSPLHDASFGDIARKRKQFSMHLDEGDALSTAAQVFTLDDIKSSSAGATTYLFESGSYDANESISKLEGLTGNNGLLAGLGIKQFAAPFFGGADGVDIRYVNPFSNARLGTGDADNYPRYSVAQAIRMCVDPEAIRYELASMPGIVNSALTDDLISTVSTRGDALAIVDIDGIYRPTWDMEGAAQAASVNTAVTQIETRNIDSSYAATYFPTIRLQGTNGLLQVPPSVAGIGAIAKSEDLSHPWFAPAGFNRGGISRLGGSSGPGVSGVDIILNKRNRDDLYNVNINPIAKFPSTGDLVIFGQKTLQTSFSSALDRINVRRLMIYLKRQIGVIADTILFDQNVQVTWNRFKAQAENVLSAVQADLGVTEYRIVLDETTTTPDLVDRNILYAQIYVKPARAIEFIAIDFIITQSGVEF